MKLFVFDLDFTLWDAGGIWCDATNPPYFWEGSCLLDQSGNEMRLYSDVVDILEELKHNNRKIAAASRTFEPDWAHDLLHLFDIDRYFDLKQIYPGSKVAHFKKIQRHFNLPYSEMVFFDDEYRNIYDVGGLGVNTVHVKAGVQISLIRRFL